MSFTIRFSKKAEKEFSEAFEWYEERSDGLGYRFEASLHKMLDVVVNTPLIFAVKKYDARESKIEDFPYLVVYKIYPRNTIFIASIFHTSRDPRKKYRR